MDITMLSTAMAQQGVQQEAAVSVQKMAMTGMKTEGSALTKMMESSKVISDPSLGNLVNVLA